MGSTRGGPRRRKIPLSPSSAPERSTEARYPVLAVFRGPEPVGIAILTAVP
jgi:hypothetical protein